MSTIALVIPEEYLATSYRPDCDLGDGVLLEPDEAKKTMATSGRSIEIRSPDDSFLKLQKRMDDYFAMGIPNTWIVDPASHRGWSVTHEGHLEALDSVLRTADHPVAMPLADLFLPDE